MRVAVVGGCGHVGLPLSLLLAERGCCVTIIDCDESKLASIKSGRFPFLEAGGPELLERCLAEFPERLSFTAEYAAAHDCDVVLLTIGTPVDEHLNPQLSSVESCIRQLRPCLQDGQTLLLRSTLFPGTSDRIRAILQEATLDIGVSFCPERIAQGYALEELVRLPQLVSGSDARALSHAKAVFSHLGVDLIELELLEAEVAKLFLNASRYVLFATANQFYQIALSKGLNYDKIFGALRHKYQRADALPGAGFTAGPCLFKDTMQLAAYCRHAFSLGHAAMLVNETMPDCIVARAKEDLAWEGKKLSELKVGVLGMAFKPNNDDCRESLAFKLRRLLRWEGCAAVMCSDVYIQQEDFVTVSQIIDECDVIFIGCPHREYRGVKFKEDQKVIDCWGSASSLKLSIQAGEGSKPIDEQIASNGRPVEQVKQWPTIPLEGKRVLLTTSPNGSAGDDTVSLLLEKGHSVVVVSNSPDRSHGHRCDHPALTILQLDVEDSDALSRLVQAHRPQILIGTAVANPSLGTYRRLCSEQRLASALVGAAVAGLESGHVERLCIARPAAEPWSQTLALAMAAAEEFALPVTVPKPSADGAFSASAAIVAAALTSEADSNLHSANGNAVSTDNHSHTPPAKKACLEGMVSREIATVRT